MTRSGSGSVGFGDNREHHWLQKVALMLCSAASKHYVAKREKVTVSLEAMGSGQNNVIELPKENGPARAVGSERRAV